MTRAASRMTKVVHLITGLNVGGAETMLSRLVARSDRARFDHVVVSMMDIGPIGERIQANGVRVHALSMRGRLPDPRGLSRLLSILQLERPDVLQTWMYHADLLGAAAARLARIPVLAWNLRCSNMEMNRSLSKWTRWMCARMSSRPDAVVVNSAAGREFHAEIGYEPRRWVLIPNGIDTGEFAPDPRARETVRQELGVGMHQVLIGLVARFDPMKDHRTFVQAAEELARTEPDACFVLAGLGVTASNPSFATAIGPHRLGARMHLLGRRADVAGICAALDIASSSSCYGEGFPNAVAEAMACQVPCVVTDVGDSARVVGDTGIVVPARSPGELAAGWQALIRNGADGRARLGRLARVRVQETFSLARSVQQYEEMYESLRRKVECMA